MSSAPETDDLLELARKVQAAAAALTPFRENPVARQRAHKAVSELGESVAELKATGALSQTRPAHTRQRPLRG